MRILRVLAVSDLHLGEDEGLLNDRGGGCPNILAETIAKIADLARGRNGYEPGIGELILLGDIFEFSEAKPAQAASNARVFFGALLERVCVDKIVYLPGNHDHHLWVKMLREEQGSVSYEECRGKTGGPIVDPPLFAGFLPPSYRGGVEVYYPCYTMSMGEGSYFLFDHGHLFSSTLRRWAGRVESLQEMEEKTTGFMEAIWFRGEGALRARLFQAREWLYDRMRAFGIRAASSRRGVSFRDDTSPVADDGLRLRLLEYLRLREFAALLNEENLRDFHFVFGHTHQGGRLLKADRKIRFGGRFITLWNTGGWLVPAEVFSPDAYLFYLEETPAGPRPEAYKLSACAWDEEGDYPREVLGKIVRGIG